MRITRRVAITSLDEFPPDTNRSFKLEGHSILLCRTATGIYAVDDRCTHQLAPLEGGRMRGHQLYCPKHGACFDLRTGQGVAPLGKRPLRSYPVHVGEDGRIEIEISIDRAHTPGDGNEENAMSASEANKQTVARFLELFSSGAIAETMAMMSDDATWWVAGTMPISGTYGKAQFEKLLTGVTDACTGPIRIAPRAWTAEGERVALEAESFADTRNGRHYNNLYHFLFTVRDGKIAGVREYLDTQHANAILCTP